MLPVAHRERLTRVCSTLSELEEYELEGKVLEDTAPFAELARPIVAATEYKTGLCTSTRVIHVDEADCSIAVSRESTMLTAIGCLIA